MYRVIQHIYFEIVKILYVIHIPLCTKFTCKCVFINLCILNGKNIYLESCAKFISFCCIVIVLTP